jgi:hypothetical protein
VGNSNVYLRELPSKRMGKHRDSSRPDHREKEALKLNLGQYTLRAAIFHIQAYKFVRYNAHLSNFQGFTMVY